MQHSLRTPLLAAAIALGATLTTIGPSYAQNWLGQAVGQAAADQQQADMELACRKGAPADPDDVAKAHTRIEDTMQKFFALNANSNPRDVEDFFDSHDPTWRDATGPVALDKLPAHMPAAAPQRTLQIMVVGGDTQTARAIWSTTPADGGVFYAGDFINHGWMGGWKIWHMTVSAAQPDMPGAYCHFDRDRSY